MFYFAYVFSDILDFGLDLCDWIPNGSMEELMINKICSLSISLSFIYLNAFTFEPKN